MNVSHSAARAAPSYRREAAPSRRREAAPSYRRESGTVIPLLVQSRVR